MDELERIKGEKLKRLMERMKGTGVQTEVKVKDGNFQEDVIVKSKEIPVLVDFWASWCAPCRTLGPVLEKLAKGYDGRFVLAKADVDENRAAAQRYGVMSIPSVKLFKDGKVIDEFVGALPEPTIRRWLDKNLGVRE
jgi:putative thioredoxin